MICPYCKSDLNSAALVCSYCQSNLALYQPIAERCERNEIKFKELYERISPPEIGPGSAIAACITVAFLSDYTSWLPFADGFKALPFQSLALVSPIVAGLLLGWQRYRMTRFAALANGAIAGLAAFATHIMVWSFCQLQAANDDCIDAMHGVEGAHCYKTDLLPPHWYASAFIYPVVGAFLLYSGQILGRKLGSAPIPTWGEDEQAATGSAVLNAIGTVVGVALWQVIQHYWK